jgi:hypothetical protein
MSHDSGDSIEPAIRPGRFLALALGFEFGLGVLAIALALVFGLRPWAAMGWDGWTLPLALAATLPMLALLPLVQRSKADWAARLRRLVEDNIVPLFAGLRGWAVALIALSAGIGEELLFRGVIQDGLAGAAGPVIALAVASLLFGLAHAVTPAYFVLATLMGVYLGGVYLATGNLLVVILAHFLYDWVALTWLLSRAQRS